ncbi:MAG: hypothetical protein OXQ84_12720 [bacterium]|nr:hypothetical protein [bacterium]
MSGAMTGGGAEVWPFLRCARPYWEARRAHALPPEQEDAPFPIRIQSEADLEPVLSWRMLAREDPLDGGRPISPFWADAPMLSGEGSAEAPPLPLAGASARLEGLRLRDGGLIPKAEKGGAVLQLCIDDDGPLLFGSGIRLYPGGGGNLSSGSSRFRMPVRIPKLTGIMVSVPRSRGAQRPPLRSAREDRAFLRISADQRFPSSGSARPVETFTDHDPETL